LTTCAKLLKDGLRTGNARHDLWACGFIPPRPKSWKEFIAALIVEGSEAVCELRQALLRQEVAVQLSAEAYRLLCRRIRQGISNGGEPVRTMELQLTQLVVQPVWAKVGSRDHCLLRIGALADTELVSLELG